MGNGFAVWQFISSLFHTYMSVSSFVVDLFSFFLLRAANSAQNKCNKLTPLSYLVGTVCTYTSMLKRYREKVRQLR